ncbi:MAG: hypothetical protein LBF90_04685 [Prevotellaceae bacterium]|jgi:hypothetical protein|nr:hypothetical protein [Prevotellaceae bacterium]
MKKIESFVLSTTDMLFAPVVVMIAFLLAGEMCLLLDGGLTVAFALGVAAHGDVMEGLLANARRWHGSIDEQFAAIDNLLSIILGRQPAWDVPAALLEELTNNHSELQALIAKCRTNMATRADRQHRNSLLKSTVGLCLLQVKIWAYAAYADEVLTADDVHLIGFLLPGEVGGRRDRTEAIDVVAEVKVSVINADVIRVIVDQSGSEDAARVVRGWPQGVRNVLIVIVAADGVTEVYRQISPRLHTDIRMPAGSHGKQFIVKASFLKHVDDAPVFGNEPTFSMPLTTEDLAALDRQHHEDFEAQLWEVERQRQEIERLHAELNAKK